MIDHDHVIPYGGYGVRAAGRVEAHFHSAELASRVAATLGGLPTRILFGALVTGLRRSTRAINPEMSEARWLMDPDRSAGRVLGFKYSPVVIGVRDAMIEWGLTGALRKSDEMQSVLVSWLTQRRP